MCKAERLPLLPTDRNTVLRALLFHSLGNLASMAVAEDHSERNTIASAGHCH
jgi:hypothetical protein